MSVKEDKAEQVIQFIDGVCWGVSPSGATVYCGTEQEVREMLEDKSRMPTNPIVREILKLEIKLQNEGEMENGRTAIQRNKITDQRSFITQRSGLMRNTKFEDKHTRLVTQGKRFPIR